MEKKKKIIITVVVILIVLIVIIGGYFLIRDKDSDSNQKLDGKPEEVSSKFEMKGNKLEDFDLEFLKLEDNDKNIIYSPLSIKYGLHMLSEGASGNTKKEIDAVIGSYESKQYENSKNMSLVNALFLLDSLKDNINKDYVDTLKSKYNASIIYDDFKSTNNINNYVKDKTLGLIDNLFSDVSEYNFILLNALAIDMEWKNLIQTDVKTYSINNTMYDVSFAHENYFTQIVPLGLDGAGYPNVRFDNKSKLVNSLEIGASINKYDIVRELGEDNIRKTVTPEYIKYLKEYGDVENIDNQEVYDYITNYIKELDSNYKKVYESTDFKFHVDDNIKIFSKELKEYDGRTLEYVGIMPIKDSLDEFIKNTNASKLNDIMKNMKTLDADNFEDGKVYKITGGIPIFQYDYEFNLSSDLKKMGIKDIFDINKRDLSNLGDIEIDEIEAKHKANISFSNEGIKASAIETIGGYGNVDPKFEYLYDVPVEVIDLTFDNPYIYLIRDVETEEVWFVGSVYEPTISDQTDPYIIND